jgi:hypothetical protein
VSDLRSLLLLIRTESFNADLVHDVCNRSDVGLVIRAAHCTQLAIGTKRGLITVQLSATWVQGGPQGAFADPWMRESTNWPEVTYGT